VLIEVRDKIKEPDTVSDDLIDIITDHNQSALDRNKATRELFYLHDSWVRQQIHRYFHNHDDVLDIGQRVWMEVLRPGRLENIYKFRIGKFRSYLRNPINWAISKHIAKLPYRTRTGEKEIISPHSFVEFNDEDVNRSVDEWYFNEAIEQVIKPNLRFIEVKHRNVYVANEYKSMFETEANINDVAHINALSIPDAEALLKSADGQRVDECTDHEVSVYLPCRYLTLID